MTLEVCKGYALNEARFAGGGGARRWLRSVRRLRPLPDSLTLGPPGLSCYGWLEEDVHAACASIVPGRTCGDDGVWSPDAGAAGRRRWRAHRGERRRVRLLRLGEGDERRPQEAG